MELVFLKVPDNRILRARFEFIKNASTWWTVGRKQNTIASCCLCWHSPACRLADVGEPWSSKIKTAQDVSRDQLCILTNVL